MRLALVVRTLAALAACLTTAACTGETVLEDVDVTLLQSSSVPTSAPTTVWLSVEGAQAAISVDTVASLEARITDVQVLPAENEAAQADNGAWISVGLGTPLTLNLMALPPDGSVPVTIASGTIPVGDYVDARLLVDSATIVFRGPISLGSSTNFAGATPYRVSVPSGTETGIKTQAAFTVHEGATADANDVRLFFSPTATFLNVTATGNTTVILTPVIREQTSGR